MKKIVLVILVALVFIPGKVLAKESSYDSYFFDGQKSTGLISDDIFGDYLLFSKEKTVSLDLEGAKLVNVLKMLSQQTGLNFISTDAVRGREMTLYIQNVPLKKAMDIIFQSNNLSYDFYPEAEMFVIKEMGKPSLELKTKVYHLKYARVLSSNMQKEIDQILKEIKEGGAGGGGSSGGSGAARTGIKKVIEQVLSESGRVVVNQATNSIVVIDVPSQFPIIDDLVARLDTPPQKIMIEVEILDVSKDVIDKIGIKHDGSVRSGISGLFTPFPNVFNPDKGPIPWRTSTLDLSDINIVAQLYKQDTTAKILARPRIITLNNETAEIDVVTDEVIGTKIEYDDDGNIQSSEAQRISDVGGYKGSGVTLRVTPQVSPLTNEITLIVYPSVVDTTTSSFTDEQGNTYRNIEDRSTRSVVRLDEGETLLLGGLIKNDEKAIVTKVPFLGDIPLLGALFRHKDTTGSGDRELLVFLTPRIIKGKSFRGKTDKRAFLSREQSNPEKEFAVDNTLNRYMLKRRD
jgi:type IV pilus assembly protein PilQ